MVDALPSLTEKEKETLRLMVRGHDAKSAARELCLSVHTINERLRAARRKLGVTSSKEAARLLFESEEHPSKSLVYEDLRDDTDDNHSDDPATQRRAITKALWIGGIIMFSIAVAAALAVSDTPAPQRPASALESVQADAVEQAASNWLALVDAQDWEGSFQAAGQQFQQPNSVETWKEASLQARTPLGALIERKVRTAEFINAPPKGYVLVKFQSQFANRAEAIEIVTLESESGVWKVVGYVID